MKYGRVTLNYKFNLVKRETNYHHHNFWKNSELVQYISLCYLSFWGCKSSSSSWDLQASRSSETRGNFASGIPRRGQARTSA